MCMCVSMFCVSFMSAHVYVCFHVLCIFLLTSMSAHVYVCFHVLCIFHVCPCVCVFPCSVYLSCLPMCMCVSMFCVSFMSAHVYVCFHVLCIFLLTSMSAHVYVFPCSVYLSADVHVCPCVCVSMFCVSFC